MTLPCFIYARFSSLEQGRGTSLARQFENGRRYAEGKGWLLDPEREISDKGRSAFHGANRAPGGALHDFERRVEQGLYRNGAVFVVEHFDRISRQGWEEVHAFLKLCTSHGVSVATTDGDRLYPAGQRIDGGTIMELVFKSEGARDESNKKSERGLDNWARKVRAIQEGNRRVNTGLPPAWLDRDRTTGEVTLNGHRAAVLREVFDLYAAGWGLPAIVRLFNARGEPTWGVGRRNTANGWNTAYLHKLLTNRAVLGEWEPMSRTHQGINEVSKGIRVADHYPQAIPADLFDRVGALRADRRFTGGPGEAAVNNLLSGAAVCRECGGPMYYQSQQKAGRPTNHRSKVDGRTLSYLAGVDRSYLMCNANRRLHECGNGARFRYEYLEPAILDAVLGLVLDDAAMTPSDQTAALQVGVAELERQTQGKRHNLQAIVDSLGEQFIRALATKAQAIEREVEEDEARLQAMRDELRRLQGRGTPREQLDRVRDVRASLDAEDKDVRYSARVRVRQALGQLVRVSCDAQGVATVILGEGLMAWRFDRRGEPLGHVDLRDRLDLHAGLTQGELAGNAPRVDAVLRRSAI